MLDDRLFLSASHDIPFLRSASEPLFMSDVGSSMIPFKPRTTPTRRHAMYKIPFNRCVAGVCLVVLMSMLAPMHGVGSQEDEGEVVTGILTEFNGTDMQAAIRTDVERVVRVKVVKPELFQRLSIGTRISVRINNRGEAIKVIEAPIPELTSPPS
jgi:hypothetical protein